MHDTCQERRSPRPTRSVVYDRTRSSVAGLDCAPTAGSVSESLLLWRLQQVGPNQITHSLDNLVANGTLSKKPDATLEKWDLHKYIVVAKDLKVVTAETATQAMLAKGFRNLIHPGRQLRLGQACNRATALSAVAAVEFIVEDLKT